MRNLGICLGLALIVAFATHVPAQKSSTPTAARPLVLTGAIPLPNVQGRIDHFGFDPKNRLFVSALGNNTEEVIDLSAQRVVHSIAGVPTPQGVVYSPETNKLFVASAKGKVYIYDGTSFDLITCIDFHGDADNLRYDAAHKPVYVGYGDDETAAIGMIDATTNKRLDEEFKLGAHPESFQLEASGSRIFVNLPDSKQDSITKILGGGALGSVTTWLSLRSRRKRMRRQLYREISDNYQNTVVRIAVVTSYEGLKRGATLHFNDKQDLSFDVWNHYNDEKRREMLFDLREAGAISKIYGLFSAIGNESLSGYAHVRGKEAAAEIVSWFNF